MRAEWKIKGETLVSERQIGPQCPVHPYTFRNFAAQYAFLLWQTGHKEFQPVK